MAIIALSTAAALLNVKNGNGWQYNISSARLLQLRENSMAACA